jgi:hypothetical protein
VTYFSVFRVQVPEAAPTQLRPDVQEEQNPRVRDRSGKKHTKIIHFYYRKPLFDNRNFIPEVNFALNRWGSSSIYAIMKNL